MLISCLCSIALTASSDYQIGAWANFSKSAVTHTFDDGTENQFSVAMPVFDKFDFKMTFATVTSGSMFPGWDVLIGAFKNGHEIASHSVTHTGTVNEAEMQKSQEAIRKNVPGEKCISMIYPFCRVPDETAIKKYYEAGRACGQGPEGPTPQNFFRVASLTVGQGGADTNLDGFANSAVKKNGWAVYLHHGVDGDHNWASTKSSALEKHLGYMHENRGKFWVESFGNVIRYIKERDNATVTEIAFGAKSISVKVTDDLDDEIYNYPLTIRRPLPPDWPDNDIAVSQAGKITNHSIITEGGTKHIQFQAVPDGGEIVIARQATAIRHKSTSTPQLDAHLLRYHKNALMVSPGPYADTDMAVRLFNLHGRELANYIFEAKAGMISRITLTEEVTRAPFIVKIYHGGKLNLVKLIFHL